MSIEDGEPNLLINMKSLDHRTALFFPPSSTSYPLSLSLSLSLSLLYGHTVYTHHGYVHETYLLHLGGGGKISIHLVVLNPMLLLDRQRNSA